MKQECLPLGGGIKSQVDSNTSRITSLETNKANKNQTITTPTTAGLEFNTANTAVAYFDYNIGSKRFRLHFWGEVGNLAVGEALNNINVTIQRQQ